MGSASSGGAVDGLVATVSPRLLGWLRSSAVWVQSSAAAQRRRTIGRSSRRSWLWTFLVERFGAIISTPAAAHELIRSPGLCPFVPEQHDATGERACLGQTQGDGSLERREVRLPAAENDGPDEQPVLVDEPSLHEGRGEGRTAHAQIALDLLGTGDLDGDVLPGQAAVVPDGAQRLREDDLGLRPPDERELRHELGPNSPTRSGADGSWPAVGQKSAIN